MRTDCSASSAAAGWARSAAWPPESFHETKNITCGEGGALLINDPRLIERAEIIREKGTNRSRFFRGQVDKYSWVDIGSSYVMSDVLAAFLYAQLEVWQTIQARRQRIWKRYDQQLRGWAQERGIGCPVVPAHCEQSHHMYYLVMPSLEKRQALISFLKSRGILSVFHYVPLHLSPMGQRMGGRPGELSGERTEKRTSGPAAFLQPISVRAIRTGDRRGPAISSMKMMDRVSSVLSFSAGSAIGCSLLAGWAGDFAHKTYLAEYATPSPGDKISRHRVRAGQHRLNHLPSRQLHRARHQPGIHPFRPRTIRLPGPAFVAVTWGLATIEGETTGTFSTSRWPSACAPSG